MPGIGLGISFVINEEPTDGSHCTTCEGIIITKMHKLYLSVDSSLSETGFELIDTTKQFCEYCKPELE